MKPRKSTLRPQNVTHLAIKADQHPAFHGWDGNMIKAAYTIAGFDSQLARLDGPQGAAELPLYAARTISVAVESAGDGDPAEQDPEGLATAYLLGETHWSR